MARRDLLLTGKSLFLIGREKLTKTPDKGKLVEVVKRRLNFDQISHVSLSTLQVEKKIVTHLLIIIACDKTKFTCGKELYFHTRVEIINPARLYFCRTTSW